MSTLLKTALSRVDEWVSAWHALRADVLSGVDGLDNDQVNTILGLLDNYEPAPSAGIPLWKHLVAGTQNVEMILPSKPTRVLCAPYDSYHSDSLSIHSGPGGFTPEQREQIRKDGDRPTCVPAKDWPAFYTPQRERTAVDGVETYETSNTSTNVTLTFKDMASNFFFVDWLISMLAERDVTTLKEPHSDRINPSDTGKSYIGKVLVNAVRRDTALTELKEFEDGQWWVKELDGVAENGTPDQKRAVAVVKKMLKVAAEVNAAIANDSQCPPQ